MTRSVGGYTGGRVSVSSVQFSMGVRRILVTLKDKDGRDATLQLDSASAQELARWLMEDAA